MNSHRHPPWRRTSTSTPHLLPVSPLGCKGSVRGRSLQATFPMPATCLTNRRPRRRLMKTRSTTMNFTEDMIYEGGQAYNGGETHSQDGCDQYAEGQKEKDVHGQEDTDNHGKTRARRWCGHRRRAIVPRGALSPSKCTKEVSTKHLNGRIHTRQG